MLAVNGEIYNHKELRAGLREPHDFQTLSDCEVILYLYDELPPKDFLNRMNGIFAFVLYDPRRADLPHRPRPHRRQSPLLGWDRNENLYVASEMKALVGHCDRIREFPPGHFYLGHEADKGFQRYYEPEWAEPGFYPSNPYDPVVLREALEAAVHRQLMCDVPYGVLISGGVDSSVVAAVAAKFRDGRVEEDDRAPAWWPRHPLLRRGSRGRAGPRPGAGRWPSTSAPSTTRSTSPCRRGSTPCRTSIYHLETFDITTIRASTPMYLMMRKIRAMGIKMVLSGEGADEVFGGYLYFHKAPDGRELHDETVRKLQKLHLYDCLRANKSSAAWGVEARVPFLDREFLDVAMTIDPALKLPRHAPRPRAHREVPAPAGLRGLHPRRGALAAEGAVLGWRGLRLDRRAEGASPSAR